MKIAKINSAPFSYSKPEEINKNSYGNKYAIKDINTPVNNNYSGALKSMVLFGRNYRNSKYEYRGSTESILSTQIAEPKIDIDYKNAANDKLDEYSKNRIRKLLESCDAYGFDDEVCAKMTDNLFKKLTKGDVESSYLSMLMDLAQDRKISVFALFKLAENKQSEGISKNAKSDIDKLYSAYANNEKIIDTFCPKYDSEDEAMDSLEVGDMCQIGQNKNVSIKTKSGIKQLFVSPETYLELFPPIERYAISQFEQGDCYILAPIDSLIQNPYTRDRIYEMFRENEDGSVDVCFNGFMEQDGEIVQKNPEEFLLKDLSSKLMERFSDPDLPYFLSQTTEGARAIELLNSMQLEDTASKRAEAMYSAFKDFLRDDDTEILKYNGQEYTKEEAECFIKFYNYDADSFYSSIDGQTRILINEKELDEELEKIGKIPHSKRNPRDKYLLAVFSRYKKCFLENRNLLRHVEKDKYDFTDSKDKKKMPMRDVLPAFIFNECEISIADIDKYNDGGLEAYIFEKLGYSNIEQPISELKSCIEDTARKNTPITSLTLSKDGHVYSATLLKDNRISVRNPYGCIAERIITIEEAQKEFSDFTLPLL